MPEDDFYDRTSQPGAETIFRSTGQRETVQLSREQPLDPPPWEIGQRVNDFVVEALLGSGVTSTVYRVLQTTTGKRCALKVMRVRSEETLSASRLGYRRVMPLSHPSLAQVYGLHQLDGRIAFTMEEVGGQPISKAVQAIAGDRQKRFTMAARLVQEVGGALQTLHGAGLVHRDVKPDNLMVEDSGLIRLVDYGLVGSFDPDSDPDARRSYLAGTYWYMAPESISSQIYPPACDVYALGCVLLELIADPAHLPDPQQGRSLGQAVGELDRVIPTDTPEELRELLHEMLDARIENRPLASQLVRYGRAGHLPAPEVYSPFRSTDLIGREAQMKLAESWFHEVARSGAGWLHISGESGTGKTWFANELRRRLSLNRWFQVFSSTCFRREDVSLQVFDEIADAIARRYSRSDRGPVTLSATSARVLSQSFPALRSIIRTEEGVKVDLEAGDQNAGMGSGGEINRHDVLRAGAEFIDQLCEYGPVLLIYDDLQWADQDSLHILDNLLNTVSGKCGVLTISRDPPPLERHADKRVNLNLDPLDRDQSLRLLRNVLPPGPLGADSKIVASLAKMGQGNAFRLIQLAAGLASDQGSKWHERLRDGAVDADQIWKSKLELLDQPSQRYLRFLATAGGPVSTELLGQVAGVEDEADLVAWELIRHRLARESTADENEIEIAHSRIADCVVRALDAAERAELHLRWANHLKQHEAVRQAAMQAMEDAPASAAAAEAKSGAEHRQKTSYAPRIAWHLLRAQRTSDAVPYARQAAADAMQRFAYSEAAKWYIRVADLVEHGQTREPLLAALQCYEASDRFAEAAELCQKLLHEPQLDPASPHVAELQRRLAENLLRCGRPEDAAGAAEPSSDDYGHRLAPPDRLAMPSKLHWFKPPRPASLWRWLATGWNRGRR